MTMSSSVSYKVGFMFPGQGAQSVGMAGALCAEVPEAKSLFDKVCFIQLFGTSISLSPLNYMSFPFI